LLTTGIEAAVNDLPALQHVEELKLMSDDGTETVPSILETDRPASDERQAQHAATA
jgi:hypothetical protein